MGLDICCDDSKLHCGYSYVQKMREVFTRATIDYLNQIDFSTIFIPKYYVDYFVPSPHDMNGGEMEHEEQENDFENDKNKLIEKLKQSLVSKFPYNINYEIWDDSRTERYIDDILNYFGIIGLKWLVKHSDSEGSYSPGQSMDIINLFCRIKEYMITHYTYDQDVIFYDELMEMFKMSIDKRKYVLFM